MHSDSEFQKQRALQRAWDFVALGDSAPVILKHFKLSHGAAGNPAPFAATLGTSIALVMRNGTKVRALSSGGPTLALKGCAKQSASGLLESRSGALLIQNQLS